ncbi:hypothetical protein D3C81_804300 [compost metagenome]
MKKSVEQRAKDILDSMTKEDFVSLLEEAGFEVTDGDGRIFDGEGRDITDEVIG